MKNIIYLFFIAFVSIWFIIGCECAKSKDDGEPIDQDSNAITDTTTAIKRDSMSTQSPPKKRHLRPLERSLEAINEVVQASKTKAKDCYRKIKRRDASLTGVVKIHFTINPAGDVIRVRYQQRNWSDSALGTEVEHCITNLIKTWRFAPIDENERNVTAPVSYIFN
ncbi:MAG: AgmX/PglI C-terminal domain-containing protein [Candidatus Electryoneaceae bacterium]|nr:AgmX/PglI C-terminal domain-containing protein [Candidatus Electryoneaceae bacterium]